ncbi:MAG: hypothetical protein HY541_01845 [Deltaproteobacteria bacterium]|nr:hypothetical protein [Deltaproteobacteria bacterium]
MKMSELAKKLGRRGGLARGRRLSPRRRKEIASLGGRAKALSRHAFRRIRRNFYGWEAVKTLRKPPWVRSLSTAKGPLPGIYARHN